MDAPLDASFSFYMLPSRFWELLAGGLLANILHLHPQKVNDSLLNKTMPALGLLLILYSVTFSEFDSSHPGFVTLVPVIGTIPIIWLANEKDIITKLLSSKAFVATELISYSLYLWHYPIFAFFRMDGLFDSTMGGGRFAAIGLTFALSIISTHYIEKVFRSPARLPNKNFLAICIIATLLIACLSYFFILKQGLPERMEGGLASGTKEIHVYRNKYWGNKSAYTKAENFNADEVSIEVIGNSWAQDIANALTESNKYQVSFRGSTGHQCKAITLASVPITIY